MTNCIIIHGHLWLNSSFLTLKLILQIGKLWRLFFVPYPLQVRQSLLMSSTCRSQFYTLSIVRVNVLKGWCKIGLPTQDVKVCVQLVLPLFFVSGHSLVNVSVQLVYRLYVYILRVFGWWCHRNWRSFDHQSLFFVH